MDKECLECGGLFTSDSSLAKYCHNEECRKKRKKVENRRSRPKGKYVQNPKYNLKRKLKSRYGLTPEQYWTMVDEQDGRCAICNRTNNNKKTKTLVVDHNHKTGKTRALLCTSCNLKLGIAEDKKFLSKAFAYLAKYED